MIVNKGLATSNGHESKDLWATPPKIYDPLNKEFGFTLDPCCLSETAKCPKYYTPIEDGLKQDWAGEIVFCNPPYSRGNIDKWARKCYEESLKPGTLVVGLFPVSTSAEWFHQWVWGKAELRFVKRRIRFMGAPFTAPFSSVIAIYTNPPKQNRQPGIHLHRTAWKSVETGKYCEWYWILIAKNGKTIARSSETYKTKRSAVRSIQIASDIFLCKGYYYDHTSGGTGVEEVNY